jgi:hypothetical protein
MKAAQIYEFLTSFQQHRASEEKTTVAESFRERNRCSEAGTGQMATAFYFFAQAPKGRTIFIELHSKQIPMSRHSAHPNKRKHLKTTRTKFR